MQQDRKSRSNEARTARTRAALMAAAREMFVERGYEATATPEIVRRAGLTRGALYHNFTDKADLFHAVVAGEAEAVAAEIEAGSAGETDALAALLAGADAWFAAMSRPGRARLLLIDGPAVLGPEAMRDTDLRTGGATLREGIAALTGEDAEAERVAVLAELLSAAFDQAALAIATGAPPPPYRVALAELLASLRPAGEMAPLPATDAKEDRGGAVSIRREGGSN